MRSLRIDIMSVKLRDKEMIERFTRTDLLKEFFDSNPDLIANQIRGE